MKGSTVGQLLQEDMAQMVTFYPTSDAQIVKESAVSNCIDDYNAEDIQRRTPCIRFCLVAENFEDAHCCTPYNLFIHNPDALMNFSGWWEEERACDWSDRLPGPILGPRPGQNPQGAPTIPNTQTSQVTSQQRVVKAHQKASKQHWASLTSRSVTVTSLSSRWGLCITALLPRTSKGTFIISG
jgi:hypothetical protein